MCDTLKQFRLLDVYGDSRIQSRQEKKRARRRDDESNSKYEMGQVWGLVVVCIKKRNETTVPFKLFYCQYIVNQITNGLGPIMVNQCLESRQF